MVFKGPLKFFILVFIFFSQSVPIKTSGLFHQKPISHSNGVRSLHGQIDRLYVF